MKYLPVYNELLLCMYINCGLKKRSPKAWIPSHQTPCWIHSSKHEATKKFIIILWKLSVYAALFQASKL